MSIRRRLHSHLKNAPPNTGWAELPTPVQRVLVPGREAEIWIKRDDLSHPRYGGGKVRKLEWLLASPRWDRDPVLSIGATGSHHLLALAEYLDLQGRRLHALVCPQYPTRHALANFLRLCELGTQITAMSSRIALPLAYTRYLWGHPKAARGRYMAPGGSCDVGLLGFVEAGLELAEQIQSQACPAFARIYISAGTAGSVAGLGVGLWLAGVSTTICAVSSVEKVFFNRWMLNRQIRACVAQLRACGATLPELSGRGKGGILAGIDFEISYEQLGAGYGEPTPAAREAQALAAALDLSFELTYTAKTWAQVLAREASGEGASLFWNTHAAQHYELPSDPKWPEDLPLSLRRWADEGLARLAQESS